MITKEMFDALSIKDALLISQKKRIALLEEKMAELRKRYFELKYANLIAIV